MSVLTKKEQTSIAGRGLKPNKRTTEKKFAYSEQTARERAYVFFGTLQKEYSGPRSQQSLHGIQKTTEAWIQIFRKAQKLQESREAKFIAEIDQFSSLQQSETKELVKEYSKSKKMSSEVMSSVQEFFQTTLVDNDIKNMLRESITLDMMTRAFDKTVKNFKIEEAIESEKKAEELTEKFAIDLYDNIVDEVAANKSSAATNKLRNLPGKNLLAFQLFKSLGYIRPTDFSGRRSQVDQIVQASLYDSSENRFKVTQKSRKRGGKLHASTVEKFFDAESYKSSLTGIRDEFLSTLSHNLKGNKHFSVEYKGTDKNDAKQMQKTDISLTIPPLSKNIPAWEVHISAKAAKIVGTKGEGNYSVPIKFSEKASLETRYEEIRNIASQKALNKADLNSLFYTINNEVLRNSKILQINELTDALSLVAFKWMFNLEDYEQIKTDNGSNVLNLFEINGTLIPASFIFYSIAEKLEGVVESGDIFVESRIYPIKKKIAEEYKKVIVPDANAKFKGVSEVEGETRRQYLWGKSRDWVQRTGEMAFYLNTNRIMKRMDLGNLKI